MIHLKSDRNKPGISGLESAAVLLKIVSSGGVQSEYNFGGIKYKYKDLLNVL